MIRGALTAIAVLLAGAAWAQDLVLPAASALVAEQVDPATDTPFPTAAWGAFDPVSARASGTVTRRVWRIASEGLTTLQILGPLRDQLVAAGYAVDFECADIACGGFDFRFALELIGEPDMHVDLGDFRYLAASRGVDGSSGRVALVVSRSHAAGFVHLTSIAPAEPGAAAPQSGAPQVTAPPLPGPPTSTNGLAGAIATTGHAVLGDLVFATGSSELGPGPFASLDALADWLTDRPEVTVVLVGHTDASGSLDQNVALSRARARAVRDRLISAYGIAADRLGAEGVGYLAPRAPNDTDAGRQLNRRVEVILPATE
ncbi:OmpA family protein [Palleronia sp. KMU-117]|uniref:OmpA family protein n=1 Tax=Palleronia sp. KMU-117 TaxID=3434108 RepID=UPI003D743531